MSWWQRIGGPNGITFLGWILLSPISILFTADVVPEGYIEGWSRLDGYVVGTISHLITGLVLLLGKLTLLSRLRDNPKPLRTVLVMGVAGITRGFTTAFGLEFFEITATADYLDRMASGSALIIIWFVAIGIVLDSRQGYRRSYQELSEKLDEQRELREKGSLILLEREQALISQVRETLNEALRVGSKAADIHQAVDSLVRPLSHNLSKSRPMLGAQKSKPRVRIRFWPIVRTAFARTPYSYGPVIFVAVLGTFYSKFWQLGFLGVIDSILSALFIWLFFSLAQRINKFGWWAWLFWFAAGLASGLTTGLFTGVNPLTDPSPVVYLSLNVVLAAIMVALLRAYDFEADQNLKSMRKILDVVHWETVALQQQAWVQQKRIARFVHSDLQARIRAFALRLEFSGNDPKPEDIEELRVECDANLALGGEYQDFERFITELQDLWEGVIEIKVSVDEAISEQLAEDAFTQIALVEIVRESVTNSVKHGRASQVEIFLSVPDYEEQHCIDLRVIDNGTAQATKPAGLGSEVLSELTLEWSLEKNETGASLSALVPLRQHQLVG